MASKQAVLNHVISFHGITGEATYPIYDWYNQVKPANIKYGAPWCAMFLSFALCASDIMPSYPVECNVDRVKDYFKKFGRWYTEKDHKPHTGDVIFFSSKHTDRDCTHIGIVICVDYENEFLVTYEGNTSNMVAPRVYQFTNNAYIVGYGDLQGQYDY